MRKHITNFIEIFIPYLCVGIFGTCLLLACSCVAELIQQPYITKQDSEPQLVVPFVNPKVPQHD